MCMRSPCLCRLAGLDERAFSYVRFLVLWVDGAAFLSLSLESLSDL